MTLEEAIQLANAGDMGAAISLGDYYLGQKNIDEAEKWYQLAAEQNIVYAVHMMVNIGKVNGYAGFKKAIAAEKMGKIGFQFACEDWKVAYGWVTRELYCLDNSLPGSEQVSRQEVMNNLHEIRYNLALCYYWENKYQQAIGLISGYQDSKSQILLGASLVQMGNLAGAAEALGTSVMDKGYDPSKNPFEEDIYAIATTQISRIHQLNNELERAVNTLQYGLSVVRTDQNKQFIANELAHYHKKLFGGYTYV